MKYKEFRAGDILNFDSSNGIFHAINVDIEPKHTSKNHPYIVRTSQNNGIRGYIVEDETKLNPGNTISFAQDTAEMFYQSEPYFTGNKVKILSVKGQELTEEKAIFLITCLKKAFSNFAWGSSYDTKALVEVPVTLPVISKQMPDFASLTEKFLGGTDMTNIDTSDWKEFKIEDLFTAESGDFDIQKNHINDLGIEIITSGTTDNGVLGKSDIDAKVIKGNTLTVDMFGNCIYRDHDYKMVTHARVFALVPIYEEFDEKAGLFISTMINKLTGEFSYSNMCSWAKIKNLTVKLPVKESEEIAWEFMEKYIRAVEKIVIADVVKYKDEVISTTKEIISKAC